MNYGIIYLTTNILHRDPNNPGVGSYVGQSIHPERMSEDLFPIETKRYVGSGVILKKVLKKYPLDNKLGVDYWVTEIIDTAETKEELNEKEIKWIAELKPEYNISEGGNGGNLGDEVNKKIGISNKGKMCSEETRKKLSEKLKNKPKPPRSKEHSKKISETKKKQYANGEYEVWNKGKINIYSNETLIKMRENNARFWLGKKRPPHTEETKKRISDAQKGNKNSLGYKHSEESKRKISKSHKGQIPWNKGKKGVQVAWNTGLTKETDERIKKYGEVESKTKKMNREILNG